MTKSPSGPRRRACEACRLRKVKCVNRDDEPRCQQCTHMNLSCSYASNSPAELKSRRSIRRGHVISEYRERNRPGQPQMLLPLLPAICSPSLNANFFSGLMGDYRTFVSNVNPVIPDSELQGYIDVLDTGGPEQAALVHAAAAATLSLNRVDTQQAAHVAELTKRCVSRALELRGAVMPSDQITVQKAMTSVFIRLALTDLGHLDTAFYYLREAVTMVQLLRISEKPHGQPVGQRLYWNVYIHERAFALNYERPAILPPLGQLPDLDPNLSPRVHDGFTRIIRVFSLVDDDFVRHWLRKGQEGPLLTLDWIEMKQKQLEEEFTLSEATFSQLPDLFQADLTITSYWLRVLVWQIAMSQCLLSSTSSKEFLSLSFPGRLSRYLHAVLNGISKDSIELNGKGMVRKLFELTNTIADVVIVHGSVYKSEDSVDMLEDSLFLTRLLLGFSRLKPPLQQTLQEKLGDLETLKSALSSPASQESRLHRQPVS